LHVNYHFFNPKAGLSYQYRQHLLYGSFAIANREPSRNNYKENVVYDALTQTYSGLPKAERLYDYELGYLFNHRIFSIGANLYYMDYDNQLVLTGKVNDVGAQSTINVKDSYRMGIELSAQVQIAKWLTWQGNVTLSRNKIQNYSETITRYDSDYNWLGEEEQLFKETTIAFSPSITAMSLFQFAYRGIGADLYTSVVGKQYLDNTQNETATLKTYTTTNLQLTYQLPLERWMKRSKVPQIRLLCQVNNLFNAKYASNGGSDCSYFENGTACWPWYYAQAGINVHAGVRIEM
jgi:iron complex outermembrane receptor protein